jgi:ABC-type dipeptide/oligopeptide/nickel transport system permease subunit
MSTPTLSAGKNMADKVAATKYQPLSPAKLAWRRFKRNKLAIVGLIIVLMYLFIGIFAPVLAPHPYDRTSLFQQWSQPGALPQFPLGTDMLGRDIMSRLFWGIRTSMIVSTFATIFVVTVGLSLGFVSGYYGGRWDFLLNRLFELMGSLPGLLFQILLIILIGNGLAWRVWCAHRCWPTKNGILSLHRIAWAPTRASWLSAICCRTS